MPALLHGAYDFIARWRSPNCEWMFLVFVLALFAVSLKLVRVGSRSLPATSTAARSLVLRITA